MSHGFAAALVALSLAGGVMAQQVQNPPNVASVVPYASTINVNYTAGQPSTPISVTLTQAFGQLYTETNVVNLNANGSSTIITNPTTYTALTTLAAASALDVNVATALSIIPLPSPASGAIFKTDAATGVPLPVDSTLGPIYAERAETIGKNGFFVSITHQDFHFTRFDGASLNGVSLVFPGGIKSNITLNGQTQSTVPASSDIAGDVRLSQNVAFLTYGITDKLDLSLAVPLVHAAVAATTYNSIVYGGAGTGDPVCWCADTLLPGVNALYAPVGAQSHLGKTGLGDLLFRLKGTVLERSNVAVAVGLDLRLPTGDALNYLGTGATSVRPFAAISFYTKPTARGIVLAPHVNFGWQLSGKSVLGGSIEPTNLATTTSAGQLSYAGAPYIFNKGYLPDVFNWTIGSEVAFGRRNTVVMDILGNQIGWLHGILSPEMVNLGQQTSPIPPYPRVAVSGFLPGARTSFGEYSGAFGYKAKVVGNLVATFNILIRFDNNGFIARAVPLYGLGYTF